MKKVIGTLIVFFILYIIYYDVKIGTLSQVKIPAQAESSSSTHREELTSPFIEKEIQAGDTAISIIEATINGKLPVSIETLMKDFEALNPGEKANSLKIGVTYKFPLYESS